MTLSECIITITTVILAIFNGFYVILLFKQIKISTKMHHLEALERGLARIHDWMKKDKDIEEQIEKNPEVKSILSIQHICAMIIREAIRYKELYKEIYGEIP